MAKVTKEELRSLKQVGGSPVGGLLVLAGIGFIAGTVILLTTPDTEEKKPDEGEPTKPDEGKPTKPADGGPAPNQGGAYPHTYVKVKRNVDALSLPKGGWVREKNEYFHSEYVKSLDGRDVVVIRKFVKA